LLIRRAPKHCDVRRNTVWDAATERTSSRRTSDMRVCHSLQLSQEEQMSKTGRKRRARKKKNANHGKRPNA
jgi:hypothetical protein